MAITYQDIPVPANVPEVFFTVPTGSTLVSVSVVSQSGSTELGLSGRIESGQNVIQRLRGEDTVGGQHVLRLALATGSDSESSLEKLVSCLKKIVSTP